MFKIFLIAGVLGIIISGIFMGVWTNGQQQRANFHSETEEHRSVKNKISMYSGMIGVTSLGISAIIYFF